MGPTRANRKALSKLPRALIGWYPFKTVRKGGQLGVYYERLLHHMEYPELAIAGFLLVYALVNAVLDWTHRMKFIEERWPKIYRVMVKAPTAALIAIIGLVLVAEGLREIHSRNEQASHLAEQPKIEQPKIATPPPAPAPAPRIATSTGDQAPAIAGDNNSVQYGGESLKKKPSPKTARTASTAIP